MELGKCQRVSGIQLLALSDFCNIIYKSHDLQDYRTMNQENTVSPPPYSPPPLHYEQAPPPTMGRDRSVHSTLPPKTHHPPAKQNIHVYNLVRYTNKKKE